MKRKGPKKGQNWSEMDQKGAKRDQKMIQKGLKRTKKIAKMSTKNLSYFFLRAAETHFRKWSKLVSDNFTPIIFEFLDLQMGKIWHQWWYRTLSCPWQSSISFGWEGTQGRCGMQEVACQNIGRKTSSHWHSSLCLLWYRPKWRRAAAALSSLNHQKAASGNVKTAQNSLSLR